MGSVAEVAEETPKLQLRMIDINCRGLTEMTCICIPYMSKGSRIVNIASAAAFCPQSGFAVYAATKSYVLSFSRGLGAELKEQGIYVTAVCPGPVDTEFFHISGTTGSLMKKTVMACPEAVVRQALLDVKDKKELSVYGAAMKGAEVVSKILPHSLVIKAMDKLGNIKQD